ncbi:MAG: hypothetical protein AEth_00391 [Candidatus Argoarchaeum ethanivorans]|uniref:CARDB domain-containing protein n=1 Tax=Candidatus Argoarchaeum ethanivorans TaxID=2608793 RepID=A0A8B6SDI2_9EURY|nr:MAG: hypothetical protein AEth_00391 [Candidatus Argoarchaeum ethanivorans]
MRNNVIWNVFLILIVLAAIMSCVTSSASAADPSIVDTGISQQYVSVPLIDPVYVDKNREFRVWYSITNPNSSNMDVILGASIEDSTGGFTDDPAKDKTVTLTPGTTWYSRYFKMPADAIYGSYDVWFGIWDESMENQLDVVENTGCLIVANTPTLSYVPVAPSSGTPSDTYTYKAIYKDLNNRDPWNKKIYVDGTEHAMEYDRTL